MLHRLAKMGAIDLHPGVGAYFIATAEVTRLLGRIGSTRTRLTNDQSTPIATRAAAWVIS